MARDIQQHVEKGRGDVPGGWAVWAGQALKPPKIHWTDKLSRTVRGAVAYRAGMLDYSYARPSRRQSALGYGHGVPILPAMVAPTPDVAVAWDTSGSMAETDHARAASELRGVLAQTNASVHLVTCDCEVHGPPRRISSWKEATSMLKGGGGTDFAPIFEALKRMPEKPSTCIVMTDGGGPAPVRPPPGITIIWVLIGKRTDSWSGAMVPWVHGGSIENKVSYGEIIFVDE